MSTFLIIVIVFSLFIIIMKSNIHIDFKSFFKKGFKKIDNKFGIICYTAKQGMGKTYCAVDFILKQLKKDKYLRVFTNVKSFYDCIQKSLYKDRVFYLPNINDIMIESKKNDCFHTLIFFDEIFTILEKKTSLRADILSFLSQLRKRRILFVTTAQEWSEINITFRRYVRYQVVPRMIPFLFHYAVIFKDINDGDLIHWDNDLQDFVAPRIELQISKGLKSVIDMYDTFETIPMSNLISKY